MVWLDWMIDLSFCCNLGFGEEQEVGFFLVVVGEVVVGGDK